MIQATRGEDFSAVINTEANRINVSLESTHIFHLVKFINDFDGEVFYCYPKRDIENRYNGMVFFWSATPNLFAYQVDLKAPGYFKYEVYEVSYISIRPPGEPESWNPLQAGYAPTTETDVLTVEDGHGIVEGLVAIGLLYLKPGTVTEGKTTETELVTYRQYVKRVQKLTIADAGSGYLSAPLITIAHPSEVGGVRATATCDINGSGEIVDLVITYAGSGYTENPVVTVTAPPGGGEQAYITATIEEENYIYSEK